MNILFISRAFPPTIGGIETLNLALFEQLSKHPGVKLTKIINTHGKKFLPVFLPWAVVKSLFQANKIDIILLGDSVLSSVAWFIKKIFPDTKIVSIACGLDITYKSSIYQFFWIKHFFKSIDQFIAISENTESLLYAKGVKENKVTRIPVGLNFSNIKKVNSSEKLENLLNTTLDDRKVIVTLGRLVKRKGVHWFVENVIPHLEENILYVIAGDGPDKNKINNLIIEKKLGHRVKLLGVIDDNEKSILLSNCHLFIQPNIAVPGDAEGFGIAVIEASAYNLPVIASDLEGLKEALSHDKNGWLVPPQNSIEYINKINSCLANTEELKSFGITSKEYSENHFDWNIIIQQYVALFESMQNSLEQ